MSSVTPVVIGLVHGRRKVGLVGLRPRPPSIGRASVHPDCRDDGHAPEGFARIRELLLGQNAIVRVAVRPGLPDLGGRDDRVPGRAMVGGGVSVRRVVAACDVSARQADPQMDPC